MAGSRAPGTRIPGWMACCRRCCGVRSPRMRRALRRLASSPRAKTRCLEARERFRLGVERLEHRHETRDRQQVVIPRGDVQQLQHHRPSRPTRKRPPAGPVSRMWQRTAQQTSPSRSGRRLIRGHQRALVCSSFHVPLSFVQTRLSESASAYRSPSLLRRQSARPCRHGFGPPDPTRPPDESPQASSTPRSLPRCRRGSTHMKSEWSRRCISVIFLLARRRESALSVLHGTRGVRWLGTTFLRPRRNEIDEHECERDRQRSPPTASCFCVRRGR